MAILHNDSINLLTIAKDDITIPNVIALCFGFFVFFIRPIELGAISDKSLELGLT